ncbi:unnamed protein product [Caenorhabditis angaria]|uniref:Phospholipase A2 domain-containing protein n=1 Tax=Caenorhabditis angaria TaxID=860376 RepID=A0A9P1MWY9_9PELO|nr:unnamed protein product [Caenorhabditis angaria]
MRTVLPRIVFISLFLLMTMKVNCENEKDDIVKVKRRRRSDIAPFLGSGGSHPDEMLIDRSNWHCGSDNFSRNFTHSEIAKNCPSLAGAVNHCCAIHDDCYGQQKGQDFCDEQFCECNRAATRLPTSQAVKCRQTLGESCTILKLLGFWAYGDSNYTNPEKHANVKPISPKSVTEIEEDYLYLYQACPHNNITLASCSINFDVCTDVHSIDFCAADLCHCILDSAQESPSMFSKNCSKETTITCRAILNYSSQILAAKSATKINVIICTVMFIAAVFMILIGWSLWKRQQQRKTQQEKQEHGKVMHTVESARSVNPLLDDETD